MLDESQANIYTRPGTLRWLPSLSPLIQSYGVRMQTHR